MTKQIRHFLTVAFAMILTHSQTAFTQVRFKTLLIDTLVTNGLTFYVSQTDSLFNMKPEPLQIETNKYQYGSQSFSCPVQLINENAVIRLRLDDKSGYLELQDLYHLNQDTIRIERFRMIRNCVDDTLFTVLTSWNVSDSGLIDPPRNIRFKTKPIPSGCKSEVPKMLTLRINGQAYTNKLQLLTEDVAYKHFHGRKPARYRKKGESYKGKKKIYFSGRTTTIRSSCYFQIKIRAIR